MNTATIILIAGTLATLGGLIALNRTVAQTRARLNLFIKHLTSIVVAGALAGSVATATNFYTSRPALIAYMSAPVVVGIIWTLYRIESAAPGRITNLIRGNGRTRRTTTGRRQPKIVSKFLPALRGWLTLAVYEDTLTWRIAHVTSVLAAWASAAFLPSPVCYIAPWLITLVSTTRWMKVQGQRNQVIQRVYAIAASHLDYNRAVSSKLTSGGAQFASPTGAISVEWTDITTPIRILIAFPVTFAKTDLAKRTTFENEFDATLPGNGWKFDWDTTATMVTITVASYPSNVRWEMRTPDGWSNFYIGDQLDDGSAATFNVESESPHILIAGETGSGKTEAMFIIAGQALLKGWNIAICDPKETGWAMWTRRRRPTNIAGEDTGADKLREGDARRNVIEHAIELYGIRDVLSRTYQEMQRRKKVNGSNKVVKWTELSEEVREKQNIMPLLVVVDEALSLFDMEKGGTDEIKERNEVRGEALGLLQKLIVEARALGIHVLLGIQRPDASVLGGAMRSNLGARVACGVMEPTGYQMMFQTTGAVPRLVVNNAEGKKVMGRALVRSSPGQPIVPIQVAWLGPGQQDLNELAPLPADPDVEDEVPSGPFNPYVSFDDPTPWLDKSFGAEEAPAKPPWESMEDDDADYADDLDSEAHSAVTAPTAEVPPWETPSPQGSPGERPAPAPAWEAFEAEEKSPATAAAPEVRPTQPRSKRSARPAGWDDGVDRRPGPSTFDMIDQIMSSAPGSSKGSDDDDDWASTSRQAQPAARPAARPAASKKPATQRRAPAAAPPSDPWKIGRAHV